MFTIGMVGYSCLKFRFLTAIEYVQQAVDQRVEHCNVEQLFNALAYQTECRSPSLRMRQAARQECVRQFIRKFRTVRAYSQ